MKCSRSQLMPQVTGSNGRIPPGFSGKHTGEVSNPEASRRKHSRREAHKRHTIISGLMIMPPTPTPSSSNITAPCQPAEPAAMKETGGLPSKRGYNNSAEKKRKQKCTSNHCGPSHGRKREEPHPRS